MTLEKKTRRVVTGHDAAGRAIFRSDDEFPLERIPIGGADFALMWTTPTVPVDNNDEVDGRVRPADLTLRGGSVIRVGDLLPGSVSPMHRSNSIDYGIVMSGQIELELDDGEKKLLNPGDIVVQRGTIHLWRNPSETETCRMIWILIEAAPYVHNGVPMDEVHP
jgi:quercetin dioxygenase-like cupin family protein